MKLPLGSLYKLAPCESAAYHFAKLIGARISLRQLQSLLQKHPDYPSLLALVDVFRHIGVSCIAQKVKTNFLPGYHTPFIATTQNKQSSQQFFSIIKAYDNDSVIVYNSEMGSTKRYSISEFNSMFTGIVLFCTDTKKSQLYKKPPPEKQEFNISAITSVVIYGFPLLIFSVVTGMYFTSEHLFNNLFLITYTALAVIGYYLTLIFIDYDLFQDASLLKSFCISKKDDSGCKNVTLSKGNSIAGFKLSSLSLVYFSTCVIAIGFSILLSVDVTSLLGYVSFLSSPIIAYSVYYQARVAKSWCPLCIIIQSVLLLEILSFCFLGYPENEFSQHFNVKSINVVILSFTIALILISFFKSIFKILTIKTEELNSLSRFKLTSEVITSTLIRQKSVEPPSEDVGIIVGNKESDNLIIMVCSPYCAPCARAHTIIDHLLCFNSNLKVQIIFTATGNSKDNRTPIVKHLIEIANKFGESLFIEALKDWYSQHSYDDDFLKEMYPLNSDLMENSQAILRMADWCTQAGITYTPSIYVSLNICQKGGRAYLLPRDYSLNDFSYYYN